MHRIIHCKRLDIQGDLGGKVKGDNISHMNMCSILTGYGDTAIEINYKQLTLTF
jgi:hypothetical protein